MSRLDSSNQTQAEAASNHLAVFLSLAFPSGTVYWTDAPKAIAFGGNTYTPSSRVLGVNGSHERSDLRLGPLQVQLSLESTNLSAMDENYQNSLATVYAGFLDGDYALVADPENYGSFFMSHDAFEDESITLTCEPVTKELFGGNPIYPSPQSQALRYPGDTGFDATQAIIGLDFEWGGVSYRMGGGSGCVCVDEELPDGRLAGDIRVGDEIEIADERFNAGKAVVTYSERKIMPCVRVTTEGGTTLDCSTSAPLATSEGLVKAKAVLGKRVAILRGLANFEKVVSVIPLGRQEVQHIAINDRCFWAGRNGYILHHNKLPIGARHQAPGVGGGGELRPFPGAVEP